MALKPEQVVDELRGAFEKEWGDPQGKPIQVNSKGILEDPFLKHFGQIGAVLTDEAIVSKCMMLLEQQMMGLKEPSQTIKTTGLVEPQASMKSEVQLGEESEPIIKKLLHRALQTEELKHFDKDVPTLVGFVPPEKFVRELLRGGKVWKDPGADPAHGEFTHRLQWWVVAKSEAVDPKFLRTAYEQIGQWFAEPTKRLVASPKFTTLFRDGAHISLWDALCDRTYVADKDNQFPRSTDFEDFRCPEVFMSWLLKNEKAFPVLTGFMIKRYAKRAVKKDKKTGEFRFFGKDYISNKLYGKNRDKLKKQEEKDRVDKLFEQRVVPFGELHPNKN